MHIADHEIIIQINLFNHDIKKIHKHVKVPNSQIWDLEYTSVWKDNLDLKKCSIRQIDIFRILAKGELQNIFMEFYKISNYEVAVKSNLG